VNLTATSIAALKLDGKTDAIWFDDALPGFGYRLREGTGGQVRRSWVVQYGRAGATRRLLLGAGDVLSAKQARDMATKVLARVRLGEDPQADKADRRGKDKHRLSSVIDDFLAVKATEVRPHTLSGLKLYLTGPHFRTLHSMPIDTVARKDVASALLAIIRQRGSATAGLARGALSGFFTWAMQHGLTEHNPVVGTKKPKAFQPRDRVLSDDELRRIWHACGDLGGDYGRIVRLLILTGQRRGEVGAMCWDELDTTRDMWTIPATRTKNGRAHSLPLLPMMRSLLADVRRRVTRDQLFGVRGNGYTAWGVGRAALDKRVGIATPWTVHDIRRSVATGMANIGVQPHIVEQVLNHVSGHKAGVAGVYNRSSYERDVRNALIMWHDHVRSVIEGSEQKILPLLPIAAG
jgi:integrase